MKPKKPLSLFLATRHGIQKVDKETRRTKVRKYKNSGRFFYYIPAKSISEAEKIYNKLEKDNAS